MRYLFIILFGILITQPCLGQFESAGLREKTIVSLNLHKGTLYAGTRDGLFAKNLDDSDASWTLLGFTGEKVTDLLVLSSNTLIAGTWNTSDSDTTYLYRSSDGGNSWQPYQNGLGSDTTSRKVIDLDKATSRGDTLFAMSPYILYRSVDRGQNWHRLLGEKQESCFGTCPHQIFVNADFSDSSLVFTAGGAGMFYSSTLYRSTDGGGSWSSKDFRRYLEVLVFHPETNEKAFVAGGSIISKTTDAGQHWRPVLDLSNHEFEDITISEKRDSLVYAGGTDRFYAGTQNDTLELLISTDGGHQWGVIRGDSSKKGGGVRQLAVLEQAKSEVIYLGTDHGLYRFTYDLTPVSTFRPQVTIRSPSDSSTHYYLSDTTRRYKGVRVIMDARDVDGQIEEFGWSVNSEEYQWTSTGTIVIPPSAFGSAGEYDIHVTARNERGQQARPDTIHVTLVEPAGTDGGILVVDDTNEEEIDHSWATDQNIDSLYAAWIHPYNNEQWDIKEHGLPSRRTLSRYQLVFWHADHYFLVSSNAHQIGRHKEALADYMDVGGDLFLSGWKVLDAMYPTIRLNLSGNYNNTYQKGSFAYSYLRIKAASSTGSNLPGNMVAATGLKNYPDVSIDSSKTKGYPVSFYTYLNSITIIEEGVKDTTEQYQKIFKYQCRRECGIPKAEDQLIGSVYNGHTFSSAYLAFPLSFMDSQHVGPAVSNILAEMGNYPTSLSQTDLPQKVRLQQNYPNPFNPSTKIRYALPHTGHVTITVYDMLGRRVATLVDGNQVAGLHTVTFNAGNLSSGIYIYRLKVGDIMKSRKMLLVK